MPHAVATLSQRIYASKILIVDDHEINRLFLEKALRAHGFDNLVEAVTAEEAIEKMAETDPDIVLLDIIMPGAMDGFACCEAIRGNAKYRDLPVLIQTSITEPETRVQAFTRGATDFISKPIHPDELCARVTVHLEKRHSMQTLQFYKNRLGAELANAKKMQQSILPSNHEIDQVEKRCNLEIASYFETSSEIGGDFWGLKLLFPSQTAFWMVDFSGHGVASALNAFRLQAYLKDNSPLTARPGDYLSHLNDKLLHLLLRGQFATMFYGIVDTQSSQLFYSCACVPNPIILRKATGKAETINGQGHPLGIGMNTYPTLATPFAVDDVLLLYSDALIETPNEYGDHISEAQLIELLEKNAGASSAMLKEIILDFFKQHACGRMRDDLTLMICTRTPVYFDV